MRLIDLDNVKPMDFPSYEMDGLDVIRHLNTLPTVDAVEVEHGQWEWDIEDIYRCTNCGAKNRVKEVMGQPDFNYCPQCGADMRGGENNV